MEFPSQSPLTSEMGVCLSHRLCVCVCARVSQVKGFEKMAWMIDTSAHPPWLRFHLGITRWGLYNSRDANLTQLTNHLTTQRILGAGEQWRKGAGLHCGLCEDGLSYFFFFWHQLSVNTNEGFVFSIWMHGDSFVVDFLIDQVDVKHLFPQRI